MRRAELWLWTVMITGTMAAGAAGQYMRDRHHGLPHRPVDQLTNWGQGRTTQVNVCPPGTFRFETDDGLFLECYNGGRQ